MESNYFLDKLSQRIKSDFPEGMDNLVIVLPNKRAKIFLIEALKKQYSRSVFAPEIISIEELIQQISGLRTIDTVELLFEFYAVYREVEQAEAKDFDHFANWATILLQDFNEIDRYLLNPSFVFSYLKDIEDIKHWALDPAQQTPLITKYLEFWNRMPLYYEQLTTYLLKEQKGYQGLLYREAVAKHLAFMAQCEDYYYFAGFNALNAAEEVIFQSFLREKKGGVFWDFDRYFLEDPYHDAGLFLRRIKQQWKHYQHSPFEWIVDEFQQAKKIEVIQTPKSIGQAKIAGKLVESLIQEGKSVDNIAVVLGDEHLLLPVLHSLPQEVSSLNITMGYSAASNPVQILLNKIFKMHLGALRRSPNGYTVYFKEVLDVLTNPILAQWLGADELVKSINQRNLTFFSLSRFNDWIDDETYPIRSLVFSSWRSFSTLEILEHLNALVRYIKDQLANDDESALLTKTFLYASFKMLNRLITYCQTYDLIRDYEALYALYTQIMNLSEVSFEGEPLQGLQVMGVLESRVLDFDYVILTSVNEGVFPAGKSQNSFIPYDVKRELGLPTFKEKDAIYSYHFYHLLLRAKEVYIIYNSQTEGIDAGEKSRFLTQLEVEPCANHSISYITYSADMPEEAGAVVSIPKSPMLQEALQRICEGKGFSPSALTSYLRNPVQFYMQRVLRIQEVEEVEESVALNTLGTIIHNALEHLYTPYVGKVLKEAHIRAIMEVADEEVQRQFEAVYNSDKEKMGMNLLAFEVAKRNVYHFLDGELKQLEKGDEVHLLELETELKYTFNDSRLPYPVKLFGFVDRIEVRNGVLRVIDYKSGKVVKGDLELKEWEGFSFELKNDKIIQLLCYALMYMEDKAAAAVEAGIYSFKNRREGFLFFTFKEGREANQSITQETLGFFREEMIALLLEILNPKVDFVEKI